METTLADVEAMCSRLLDSEEHAVTVAIPQVAVDAADLIQRMSAEIAQLSTEKQDLASQRTESVQTTQLCAALARMVNTFGTSHKCLPEQPTNAQVATQLSRDALAACGEEVLIKDHLISAGLAPIPADWNPVWLPASVTAVA